MSAVTAAVAAFKKADAGIDPLDCGGLPLEEKIERALIAAAKIAYPSFAGSRPRIIVKRK